MFVVPGWLGFFLSSEFDASCGRFLVKDFEFPFVSKVDLYKLRGKRGEYGSNLDVIATLVLDRIVASLLLDGALLDSTNS